MAVTSMILNSTLVLETSNGVDDNGNEKWTKKSFQGVKTDANVELIHDVATAISGVLGVTTRGFHLMNKVVLTKTV